MTDVEVRVLLMPMCDHAEAFNFRNEMECWGCLSLNCSPQVQGWTVGKPERQAGYDTADPRCTNYVTIERQEQCECSKRNQF